MAREETVILGESGRRILNCLPSRDTEKDWTFEDAKDAGLLAAGPIPEAKDLREDWWEIGDQGQTGSCVGWAAADSVLRWHFVKAGRISPEQEVSVRYFWMASKETDPFITRPSTFIEEAGTTLKAALDVARRLGAVTKDVLAFIPSTLYQGGEEAFWALASQLKISSYFALQQHEWRSWLANEGPILTRLNVDPTWDNAAATNGRLQTYIANQSRGGHAVAIVGYEPGEFIVRNSWGESWGDRGFGYASNAYAQAAFTEAYGVRV